jgi:hypothetical protein
MFLGAANVAFNVVITETGIGGIVSIEPHRAVVAKADLKNFRTQKNHQET